jgi:FkbM family methyltransferase
LERLIQSQGLGSGKAVDIGANIGNHTAWLAKRFTRVAAIEPSAMLCNVLRANCMLNRLENVDVLEIALSDTRGSAYLEQQVPGNMGALELNQERASLATPGELAEEREVPTNRIRIERGDDVLLETGSEPRIPLEFVKIDVEGMEVQVLEGLKGCLSKDAPIVCFEARSAAEGQPVIRKLQEFGYLHFYEIAVSRFEPSMLLKLHRADTWRKWYSLREATQLEDRFHAAVIASVQPLQ